MRERVLVCGNLLLWGLHGVAFAAGEDASALWPAVAEALYRLRRADKLSGDADLVMVKDIPGEHAGADELSKFSYHQLETDPDMVLEIPTRWASYEDYLWSLNAKYRKAARQVEKDVAAAGCRVEELRDVGRHAEELRGLYMQTHRNARLRLVTLPAAYLPALAERLGVGMRCTVVRRDERGSSYPIVSTPVMSDGDYIGGQQSKLKRIAPPNNEENNSNCSGLPRRAGLMVSGLPTSGGPPCLTCKTPASGI